MNVLPIVNKVSVYSIGYDYISFMFGNKINNEDQARVLQVFNNVLDLGYCAEDIYYLLNVLINNNEIDTLSDINKLYNYFVKHQNNKININLLNSTIVRTHKELQLTCSAPVIELEPSIFNKFEVIKEEYFLEPKASYSFNELKHYIKSKSKYILVENNNEKKIDGALQYMLNNWGNINVLLFAFDRAIEECEKKDRKLKDLFDLSDYLDDAIKMDKKIIDRIEYGDIRFVPKKRLLFERSGLLDRQEQKAI